MRATLLYQFSGSTGETNYLSFSNPLAVYQTAKLEEVPYLFRKVEKALGQGYYAAGYVSYEAAPAFDASLPVHSDPRLPLVWFGIFHKPGENRETAETSAAYQISEWQLDTSFEDYEKGINRIKEAIRQGDTYQVNYTSRMHAAFSGNERALYEQLTRNQAASYSACLNLGRYQILSASPELFFRVKDQKITTKPMKGTAPRGRFKEEDRLRKQALYASEKERAENVMIVDLLRNDLGRIARPGTVRVPRLFDIESYPTVHQMTSTIEAELKNNTTVYEWFQALFPCGSVTGAPKASTMKYIKELEPSPREVYCGAIGYLTPEREAVFNVAIRTIIIDSETEEATYGVGGGITWDSTVTGEYEELAVKAKVLKENQEDFEMLESLRLTDGSFPLLSYHLSRLHYSANFFAFPLKAEEVKAKLEQFAISHPAGNYKVRLRLSRHRNINIEGAPLPVLHEPVCCSLAKEPIADSLFLYHKTTNREIYEPFANPDTFSTLLWNEKEELTEFTFGNLAVERNGCFYTPPVSCGLLPGTFRQKLLEDGVLKERVIHKEELTDFKIWFINSVRGWLRAELPGEDQKAAK